MSQEKQQPQQESNVFDDVTGFVTEEAELELAIADLNKVISQAEALSEMKSTDGWGILEKFVKESINSLTKELIIENDFEKIRRIQSEIIAFDSLFGIIEQSFSDAEKAKEQLNKLIEP